jgi:hypothetical protein
LQRANFVLTGALYCIATRGLARNPGRGVAGRVVSVLNFGVGAGLIGSGIFVTDPVAGFPPDPSAHQPGPEDTTSPPTREGMLHNSAAVPIFVGIPIAATTCAVTAARSGDASWATYSAASAATMTFACGRFGAAFSGPASLAGRGGLWQRISIVIGFGWLSALSFRALTSLRASTRT